MHTKYTEYFAYRDNFFVQFSIFFSQSLNALFKLCIPKFKKKVTPQQTKIQRVIFWKSEHSIIIQINDFVAAPTLWFLT